MSESSAGFGLFVGKALDLARGRAVVPGQGMGRWRRSPFSGNNFQSCPICFSSWQAWRMGVFRMAALMRRLSVY